MRHRYWLKMRVLNEWKFILVVMVSIMLFSYITLDEEPLFDLSDLNLFHLLWFFFAIISIFIDNYTRLQLGQNVEKDRSLITYLLSYTLNILLYFIVIWVIFFLHIITPLNLNLLDDAFPVYNLLSLFSPILLKNLFSLVTLWLAAFIMSKNQNSIALVKLLGLINFVVCMLLLYWTIDFTTTQITSSKSVLLENKNSAITKNKSAATYSSDAVLNGFEWHLSSDRGHLIGFVDFASILIWFLFLVWFLLFFVFLVLVFICSYSVDSTFILRGNVVGFFMSVVSFVFVVYLIIFTLFYFYWIMLLLTTCGLY